MRGKLAFAAWLAAIYGGMLATAAAVVVLIGAGMPEDDRAGLYRLLAAEAPTLGLLAALLLPVCGALAAWLVRRYVIAPRSLAEQTRGLVAASPGYRVDASGARELDALAAEINRLAVAYHGVQTDTAGKIAEAGSRLEEERNRLAAVMSDLSQGVLLCNADGRILLYNERARMLFSTAAVPIGLGRSVFGVLDRDELVHALDKLQHALDRGAASPSTRFVTAVPSRGLVRVQVAPFLDAGGRIGGVVLAIEDVTRYVGHEFQRRPLMQALAAGIRAPTASIRAAAENMVEFPEMDVAQRQRFARIIAEESIALSRSIDQALSEYAEAIGASMSLEDIRAADLVALALSRIGALLRAEADDVDPQLWLRVDSFALLQSLVYVARHLRDELGVQAARLRARAKPGFAELDLAWSGGPVPGDVLALWEAQPMPAGPKQAPLTLRDVLERHGGEMWQERDEASGECCLRFLLPLGEAAPQTVQRRPGESRPEYFDFDLFRSTGTQKAFDDQRLGEIAYTVFDTETTGLQPSAGDEIISLGAVRIVNGRLLTHEVFEQLVDPRRPISPESSRIHGIEAPMLASQPTLAEVLPAFHRFCEDTVLVAHNAAFDMRFLELKEAVTGIRFDQPVLDTLLLSVAVHPSLQDHGLEAIAERLGVRVIGRHTALGDALLTGEILLRLIPLLAERGIETLKQARDASQRTYHARLRY
ncbi:MAG TPA: exonuclease domain-containing protein [Casimicrobiaceae bacterium]|jgi:DNA polymerase-3 subunit epsilon